MLIQLAFVYAISKRLFHQPYIGLIDQMSSDLAIDFIGDVDKAIKFLKH